MKDTATTVSGHSAASYPNARSDIIFRILSRTISTKCMSHKKWRDSRPCGNCCKAYEVGGLLRALHFGAWRNEAVRVCVTGGISDGRAESLSWRVSEGDVLSDTEPRPIYRHMSMWLESNEYMTDTTERNPFSLNPNWHELLITPLIPISQPTSNHELLPRNHSILQV